MFNLTTEWNDWNSRVDHGKIRRQRLEGLQHEMKSEGVDALLLTWPENLRYACDLVVPYGVTWATRYAAVIFPEGLPVALPGGGACEPYKDIMHWVEDIRPLPVEPPNWVGTIKEVLETRRVVDGKIGIDILPFALGKALEEALPNASFVDAEKILTVARMIKSEEEIKAIREAVEVAELGIDAAIRKTTAGVTEYEIAAAAIATMVSAGAEGIAFYPIVHSGPAAARLSKLPTKKRVRDGELVIIDLGSLYNGYHGIVGRTICVGKPSEEQKKIYKTVYKAEKEAIDTMKPGIKVSEVDKVARNVIRETGYGKYMHANVTGWGTGTKRLEPPVIGEPEMTKAEGEEEPELKPGMTIVLEPGIFCRDDPEVGGVRLSDMVLVTNTGSEVLTKVRYDEKLLGET